MNSYSVMIIDDNEVDRYLLKRQLDQTGLDITVFEQPDGEDAIEFLANYGLNREKFPEDFPPMLLFLDINMPKLDGWGFLERFSELRTEHDIASTVVVMFTSSDREEDRGKAKLFDFVRSYLVKGEFESDQLHTLLTMAA